MDEKDNMDEFDRIMSRGDEPEETTGLFKSTMLLLYLVVVVCVCVLLAAGTFWLAKEIIL